jgi:hypothetical protein
MLKHVTLLALAVALLLPPPAAAVSKTFVPSSGDWFAGDNWNPAGVPASDDDVTIPAGRTAQLNAPASISTLTLQGTLTGTGTLTVSGMTT